MDFTDSRFVPVRWAGEMIGMQAGQEKNIALVQLDARGHPEVRDLPRVFRSENCGRVKSLPLRFFVEEARAMVVTVAFSEPVEVGFMYALMWPQHKDFFLRAKENKGYYWSAEEQVLSTQDCVYATVDLHDLSLAIKLWQEGEAQ